MFLDIQGIQKAPNNQYLTSSYQQDFVDLPPPIVMENAL